jgi:hypothetical protein
MTAELPAAISALSRCSFGEGGILSVDSRRTFDMVPIT